MLVNWFQFVMPLPPNTVFRSAMVMTLLVAKLQPAGGWMTTAIAVWETGTMTGLVAPETALSALAIWVAFGPSSVPMNWNVLFRTPPLKPMAVRPEPELVDV